MRRRHAPCSSRARLRASSCVMNYTESMAKGFAFLSVVVTAANLPLYLFCALAILVLWRRGEISRPTRREMLLRVCGSDCDRLFDLAVRRRWYQVVVMGRCSGPGRCAGLLVDASQPDVCGRIARWGVTWREWLPLRDDPSDQSPFVVSRSLCSRRLRAARAHLKRPSLASAVPQVAHAPFAPDSGSLAVHCPTLIDGVSNQPSQDVTVLIQRWPHRVDDQWNAAS